MNDSVEIYSVAVKITITLPDKKKPVHRRIQEAINEYLVGSIPQCAAWHLWLASNRWEKHADPNYFSATARFVAFGIRSYQENQQSPGLETIQQEFDRIIPRPVPLSSGYVLHPVKILKIYTPPDGLGEYLTWLDFYVAPALESDQLKALAPDITTRFRQDINEMRHGPVPTEDERRYFADLDEWMNQQMRAANGQERLGDQ